MDKTSSAYHHGSLKEALVHAAYAAARADGPSAIRLRSLARQNQVTPSAVYRHFANQEDLLRAVKQKISEQLAEAMRNAAQSSIAYPQPSVLAAVQAQLRALCRAYVAFALAEPGLFRTASSPETARLYTPEQLQNDNAAFRTLRSILAPLIALGYKTPDSILQAEVTLWASAHGLAVLLLDSPLSRMSQDDQQRLIDATITTILDGLDIKT